MSLIKGLDEKSKYNVGENCHIQLNWSEKVELDWNKLYPKTLQRKFQWVEQTE